MDTTNGVDLWAGASDCNVTLDAVHRETVTLDADISESWRDYTLTVDEDGLAERGVTVMRIQP